MFTAAFQLVETAATKNVLQTLEKDMKNLNPEIGMVAVLDALGASTYSDEEVQRFLRSREVVMELLNEKVVRTLGEIKKERVNTFIFNDTVLITLRANGVDIRLNDIGAFYLILRKFFIDSLAHQILFRGSIACGTYYVDDKTNTVMGQAVTDAAAWYDKANWIGVHATPHTTLFIQSLLESSTKKLIPLLIDYDIPLKNDTTVKAKALNWPNAFFQSDISPCKNGESQRVKILELLTTGRIPIGTEQKFFNTLTFFDFIVEEINLSSSKNNSENT